MVVGDPKNDLFSNERDRIKNDQILKSAIFTCLCPKGSRPVVKLPWESFLSANNALTKYFPLNPNPDFIFSALFLCP